jgi:hypothetical protein
LVAEEGWDIECICICYLLSYMLLNRSNMHSLAKAQTLLHQHQILMLSILA